MGTGELPRRLGLLDASLTVMGIVIGAGIFLVPNLVARNLPSAGLVMAVWIAAGLLSFGGALAYAELGGMLPETGGQYVYLREAFGSLWAFLCGWTLGLVFLSGAIAWLAVSFALYLSGFVPLGRLGSKLVAVALIAALTVVNYRGIRAGALVQRVCTLLKLAGLAILIGAAWLARAPAPPAPEPRIPFSWSALGVAMIACLLCYDGWGNVTLIGGEIRDPQRNLPRALALGVGAVMGVYLLANLAYLRVLPLAALASTERPGAEVATRILGPLGAALVSVTVLLSIAGADHGQLMTVPRILFAQARDGLFFARFAHTHPRFETPSFSIAAHGVWAAILALTGSYEALVAYTMFAGWFFYALTVAALLRLRRKRPDAARPYRMWGAPATPLLFIAVAGWLVVNSTVSRPGPSLAGIGIIAAGVPVYFFWRRSAHGRSFALAQRVPHPG